METHERRGTGDVLLTIRDERGEIERYNIAYLPTLQIAYSSTSFGLSKEANPPSQKGMLSARRVPENEKL